jgi:hypothetical protein
MPDLLRLYLDQSEVVDTQKANALYAQTKGLFQWLYTKIR